MSDLGDILDELQADQPLVESGRKQLRTGVPRVEFGRGYWDRVLATGFKDFNADLMDRPCPPKESNVTILYLTQYEIWWLEWRLKVHLRSQRSLEWIEMEDVIQCLLTRISTLSTSLPLGEVNSSTPVEELSKPLSMECSGLPQNQDSAVSSAPTVSTEPSGTQTESVSKS